MVPIGDYGVQVRQPEKKNNQFAKSNCVLQNWFSPVCFVCRVGQSGFSFVSGWSLPLGLAQAVCIVVFNPVPVYPLHRHTSAQDLGNSVLKTSERGCPEDANALATLLGWAALDSVDHSSIMQSSAAKKMVPIQDYGAQVRQPATKTIRMQSHVVFC